MWSLVALYPFSNRVLNARKLELFSDVQDSWYGTVWLWCSLSLFFLILGNLDNIYLLRVKS